MPTKISFTLKTDGFGLLPAGKPAKLKFAELLRVLAIVLKPAKCLLPIVTAVANPIRFR